MIFILYISSLLLYPALLMMLTAAITVMLQMPLVFVLAILGRIAQESAEDPVVSKFRDYSTEFGAATSACIVLYLTNYIWAKWGYSIGWLFPLLVLIISFLQSSAREVNKGTQLIMEGSALGVALYGISRIFI